MHTASSHRFFLKRLTYNQRGLSIAGMYIYDSRVSNRVRYDPWVFRGGIQCRTVLLLNPSARGEMQKEFQPTGVVHSCHTNGRALTRISSDRQITLSVLRSHDHRVSHRRCGRREDQVVLRACDHPLNRFHARRNSDASCEDPPADARPLCRHRAVRPRCAAEHSVVERNTAVEIYRSCRSTDHVDLHDPSRSAPARSP